MLKPIAELLNIRPTEGRPLFWLLVHSFFMGLFIVFYETAASTLYLTQFSVQTLPYAYIGSALIVAVFGFIYSKCEEIFSFSKLLIGSLIFVFVSVCILRFLLSLSASKWPVMAIFIWIDVTYILLHIEFWGLTGRIFNVIQGKRLFGLIGSGEVAAYITGGFIIPIIVSFTGAANLFLFSAFAIICSSVILLYILRSFSAQISSDEDPEEGSFALKEMIKNRFLIFIIIISTISVLGYYFIDYAFYGKVDSKYSDEKSLASFFGMFFAIVGIVHLFFKTFISGRLLSRFGLNIGLFGLPFMLALASIAMVVIGNIQPAIALFFWVVIITKLFDIILRGSIEEPSIYILYQPFPASQRLGAQTIVESIVEPLAGGLAGVILLLFGFLFHFQLNHIPYFMFLLLTGWIITAFFVRREYLITLGKALGKRILHRKSILLEDGSSIDVLKMGLRSSHAGEVIFCLNMLEEIEHNSLDSFLIDLLNHPSPEVRADVLHKIERLHITAALDAVTQRLALEESPLVLGDTIRTSASLSGAEGIDQFLPYIEDKDKNIKKGVMVGLLRSGGIQGVLSAGAELLKMVASKNPEDREFAAQVLGEIGIRDFYQPLMELIRDENFKVRKEALVSAGKLKNPRLWSLVVENLSVPEVYSTAVSSLVSGGDTTLPELERAFSKKDQNPELQCRIIRILGQIHVNQVVDKLLEKITTRNKKISYQILLVLSLCRYHVKNEDYPVIQRKLHEEISDVVWILAALRDIEHLKSGSLLKAALYNILEKSRKRIFFLLSFIYDSNAILQARDNLTNRSKGKRAYALEIIYNIISQELKSLIMPLIDDIPDNKRLYKLIRGFPQEKMAVSSRLRDIVKHAEEWGNTWLESCALYTMVELSCKETINSVVSALSHADPLVRETSAWSLAKLDIKKFKKHIDILKKDSAPQVINVIHLIENETIDKAVLTIDKVTFLKKTNIFAHTPENILVSVAERLKEIHVKAGEAIITQGEKGDCMYIITEGLVHVYSNSKSIAHLGPKDFFGEFAIIDSEPRSASVAAEDETHLLRLDQSTFCALMAEQTEVARGIIKVLCQRLDKMLEKASKIEQIKVDAEESLKTFKEEKELSKEVLLPLEKVLILKTISFFSYIPDNILEEIISIIEEVKFKAGEKIVEKGEMGRSMYIITSGQVRVHDGEHIITYLENRAFFGETSVLDTKPWSASVTAEQETCLLRLDQEPLYELMADRFELANGIIYALIRQIRNLLDRQ